MINRESNYEYFAVPWYRFKVKRLSRNNVFSTKTSENYNGFLLSSDEGMITVSDNYQWHTSVWMTFPFSHVYRTVENFILQCHQNGLIEYWQSLFYPDKSVKVAEKPKKLTVLVLSAGFYLWLSSVCVACFVFIGELAFSRIDTVRVKFRVLIAKFRDRRKKTNKKLKKRKIKRRKKFKKIK